jgi:hypothetical protein
VYKCNSCPSLCAVGIAGLQVVYLMPDEINMGSKVYVLVKLVVCGFFFTCVACMCGIHIGNMYLDYI